MLYFYSMEKKTQAAVEMIIILALALVIIISIVSFSQKSALSASGQYEAARAKATLDDLANTAELVYQQGFGARTKLYLTIPDNVINTNVSSNVISMRLAAGGTISDVHRNTDFTITGSIPKDAGNYWFFVEAKDGYVQITPNVTIGEVCGNNIRAEDEVCDGYDLNGESCFTQGYYGGTLLCLPDCSGFDDTNCLVTQASCLFLDTSDAALTSANKKLTGLSILNNCDDEILLIQANITWVVDAGEKIDKITIDNEDKWDRNCHWGCTPTGSQGSSVLLDFGSRDYSLQANDSVDVDWIDFDSDMSGKDFIIAFIFNDGSIATNNVTFT